MTASIHRLFTPAGEHADVATQRELDWFITEQVEEEENAGRAVDLLTRAGTDTAALLFLDREFGTRSKEGDWGRRRWSGRTVSSARADGLELERPEGTSGWL